MKNHRELKEEWLDLWLECPDCRGILTRWVAKRLFVNVEHVIKVAKVEEAEKQCQNDSEL